MSDTILPVKAKPYLHQIQAFAYACETFGLVGGGDQNRISRSPGIAYLMEMG